MFTRQRVGDSIKDKALRAFYNDRDTRGLQEQQHVGRYERILAILDGATSPEDCNVPGYDFHQWKSSTTYSLKINKNRRILFEWEGEEAINVRQGDPH